MSSWRSGHIGGISPDSGVLFGDHKSPGWLKSVHSRLPYAIRRRVPRGHLGTLLAVALVLVALIVVFQVYVLARWILKDSSTLKLPKGEKRPLVSPAPVAVVVHAPKARESSQNWLGVPIGLRAHYVPDDDGMFTCIHSDPVVRIPFSRVNDDYCDCLSDGSDEPSTGACSGVVAGASFTCSAEAESGGREHKAVIPASRVNDGVCDCCDGSDEWRPEDSPFGDRTLDKAVQSRLGRYQSPCPNKC